MNDIRRIMVAVDFSSIGRSLVRYALALARKIDAEVHLVNIINQRDVEALRMVSEVTTAFSLPEQLESQREDRMSGLNTLLFDLELPPQAIARHVRMGIPYEALTSAIKELDIDLLIMGTRGRGQFSGMLFGSTAARMLSRCPVPLLTLRNND
jgi:nucleotide-binding universal stress UspA family protein